MKIIQAIFSICCHQDAARSPNYSGEIFPACYRCAGLYFGIISCYLFLFLKKDATYFSPGRKTGSALTLFTLPLFIDGLANLSGGWSTPGAIRTLTGVLCGIALPLLLILIRNSTLSPHLLHKISPSYFFAPLIICCCFIFLLIFASSLFIFHAMAIIAAAGMILFFLNMILSLIYLKSPVL